MKKTICEKCELYCPDYINEVIIDGEVKYLCPDCADNAEDEYLETK